MKATFTIFSCILFLGATWFGVQQIPQKLTTQKKSQPSKKLSIKSSLVVSLGRLEPTNDSRVGATAGTTIDQICIREGQYVKKGQILSYLNTHQAKLQEKNFIQSQIDENKKRLASDTAYASSLVEEAKVQLETFKKTQEVELNAQQILIDIAQEDLEFAIRELKRLRNMQGKGVSAQDVEKQSYTVAKNRQNLKYQENTLSQLAIQKNMSILMAEKQLQTAQRRKLQVENSIAIRSLEEQLELVNEQVKQTIIHSPTDGQVLKIFTHEGENVNATPIMHVSDTKKMNVIAEVYQSDVKKIRLGQQATIHSNSFSKTLTGKVTSIGNLIYKNDVLGVDPSAKKDARVVEVVIALDDSTEAEDFTNLQVTVKINVRGWNK